MMAWLKQRAQRQWPLKRGKKMPLTVRPRRPLAYDAMVNQAANARPRFFVLSGCQGAMVAGYLQALTLGQASHRYLSQAKIKTFIEGEWQHYRPELEAVDYIVTQKKKLADFLVSHTPYKHKVRYFPIINVKGFHPDIVYLRNGAERFVGPMGDYHSLIITAAYFAGLSETEARACFTPTVYRGLGFVEQFDQSRHALQKRFSAEGIDLQKDIQRWDQHGTWMRTVNHPKGFVIHDVVVRVLERDGISLHNTASSRVDWVEDDLARSAEWPAYPGLGLSQNTALGDSESARNTSLIFKTPYKYQGKSILLDIESFVSHSYASLEGVSFDEMSTNGADLATAVQFLRDHQLSHSLV
ncbi:MAG: WcbI family polysaccharide biosynthesis putative acetyltransferase [Pseudomonadota bacterium]